MNSPKLEIKIDEVKYGLNKIILKNINITIDGFGLYGFFGKNGQGKSTFLKSIAGLKSYEGYVLYNENELTPDNVAILTTEPNVYEYLTAKEFYNFYQKVSGRKKNISKEKLFSIDENILLKSMSTGTLKKAYYNSILQFDDYNVYIFDEPFNGLDIESNYVLLDEINRLSKENIVFISSHIIEIIQPYLSKTFYVNNQTIEELVDINLNEILLKKDEILGYN